MTTTATMKTGGYLAGVLAEMRAEYAAREARRAAWCLKVRIDGQETATTNALSSGPGCKAHTYELSHGAWVQEIAGTWWLHQPGQFPRAVSVEVVA